MALLDDHRLAMEYAEQAGAAKRAQMLAAATILFRQAFRYESIAAQAATLEPTRSILHRSAATLACDCEEWEEAQRLAEAGLADDAPEEIREELQEVLERAKRGSEGDYER